MTEGRRSSAPGVPALVFLFWAAVTPLLFQQRLLNGDGDPARHIRHGLWILEHGGVIRQDPFSFTKPGDPFVGFEYGSQVLLALAHEWGGLAGVTLLAAFLIAATYALVARFLLRRGVDPLLAWLGAMAAAVVGQAHWMARPHLVTFVGTLLLLELLERERPLPVLPTAALFVAWTSLHGGVLFGFFLIGFYLAAAAWDRRWRDAARCGLGLLLAGAALFSTPYGTELPRHLGGFLEEPYLREQTGEFFSPDFRWLGMKPFLLAVLGTIAALAWSRRVPAASHLLVITGTLGMAFLAQRNVALFAITGLPLLLLHLDTEWQALPDKGGLRAGFAHGAQRAISWPWVAAGTLGLLLLARAHGRVGGSQLVADAFEPRVFPVAAVDSARAAGLTGRYFTEFTWAGYMLYAWPSEKVFIDGGTDFYGSELFRTHIGIRTLRPGWRDSLARWEVDRVLVQPKSGLAAELLRDRGWQQWYADSTAVLIVKGQAPR